MYVCISYAKGNGNIRKPPEKRGPFTRKNQNKKKKQKSTKNKKKTTTFQLYLAFVYQ